MQQIVAGLGGDTGQEKLLAEAQELMYEAFEEPDEERQIELAKQALEICPDCADAYVLLAEHEPNCKHALALYEQGVAAGARALGPVAFQRSVGHFWGILETRPYMRARFGLAETLWTLGRREEAIQHLQEMLRLNPNDNQGLRYTLAGFLLFLDRDDDLTQLLDQYPEEGLAAWDYTRALLVFRRHGDTAEARQLLQQARKTNKHVPAYLTGEKLPPSEPPPSISPGAKSEAFEYIHGFLPSWKATPGAIAWLRANVKPRKKAAGPQPKGPLTLVKKWLKERLPQFDDVWQADCRQMPTWVRIAGESVRPWIVMVTDRSRDLILAFQSPEGTPSAALVWDVLVEAMQNPHIGEPHRPSEIQVRPHEHWDALRPHVEEIGVRLALGDDLDRLQEAFDEMAEQVCGKPQPGLLDMPGITPAQVGSCYEAAAAFFQDAPWKQLGYRAAIQVECAKFSGGPWYAVVMGQSGVTRGLSLYEDLATLKRVWEDGAGDEENARQTVATTLMFEEEFDMVVADLEAARRHGWKVARPDAHPSIFHKERGLAIRPPLAWELELMEGCLRSIPGFVRSHRQDDPAREEVTVPVPSGLLRLGLSWVDS